MYISFYHNRVHQHCGQKTCLVVGLAFQSMLCRCTRLVALALPLKSTATTSTPRIRAFTTTNRCMALSWDAINSRRTLIADGLFSIGTTTQIIPDHGVDVRLTTSCREN